jgi:hypothetical protein
MPERSSPKFNISEQTSVSHALPVRSARHSLLAIAHGVNIPVLETTNQWMVMNQ